MALFSDFSWKMARGACCITALLLLAPLAAAQTQPPAATATAPAEPTPSHLAAARALVVASGMSRSFEAAIPQMMHTLASNYAQTRPEIMADLGAVLTSIKPEFSKDIDQMTDKAAHIYARLLSEDEIKATITFFNGPAGKKYVQAEPIFFNEVINAMQDWHQQIADKLMTRVRDEMKKKGHPL